MKKLIIIGGPTASGKTALSITLAKEWNVPIISADSRQFYKEMSIGTAKPSLDEMQNVPHYFIDSHSINNELTSSLFAKEAEILLEKLFQQHDKVILTGGSGMFIEALCYGLDNIPHDKIIQDQLNTEFSEEGLEKLLKELSEKDPEFYTIVDKKNPIRVIRAIEAIRITGSPYSTLRKGKKKTNSYQLHYFVIDVPREILYDRINLRVDKMIEQGLEEEAKSLFSYKHLKPLSSVGYSEWFSYFNGEIDRERCIELIKQNSRRYAKRQITWFKRNEEAIWVPYSDNMKTEILKQVNHSKE